VTPIVPLFVFCIWLIYLLLISLSKHVRVYMYSQEHQNRMDKPDTCFGHTDSIKNYQLEFHHVYRQDYFLDQLVC